MRINKLLTNGYELTEEEKANLKVTLQDVIGEIQSEEGYWRPFVNGTNGNLYWEWDTSPTGNTPAQRKILYWPAFSADPENSHLLWKLDDDESWTDLNITTSGARGPQGDPGEKGADGTDGTSVYLKSVTDAQGGKQVTLGWGTSDTSAFVIPSGAAGTPGANGISPTVTITDAPTTEHPQGGKTVTITDATHPGGQSFDIWNGIDGQGATVNLIEGTGIQITHEGGTTNYTIGVSADYALKSYANEASANALGQAKTWVGQQNFASSAGLDSNKQYAMTTNGWSDFTIPSVPDITPSNGLSANGHTVGISNAGIDADTQYAWTTSGWKEVQGGYAFDTVGAGHTLSGDGDTNPIGVNTDEFYRKSQTSGASQLTNEFNTRTDYYPNTNDNTLKAQRLFVCTSDNDIISHASHADGKGSIFFRLG